MRFFVEKTDQSNVNRLLMEYPWHKADFVDELCMLFKKHRIPSSFSFFLLDDTLLEAELSTGVSPVA